MALIFNRLEHTRLNALINIEPLLVTVIQDKWSTLDATTVTNCLPLRYQQVQPTCRNRSLVLDDAS